MTHNPADSCALLARVEKLERQNRRLLTWGVTVALGLGLVAISGAQAPNGMGVIEATQLVIKDENGQRRIVLGSTPIEGSKKNRTGVFVYDEKDTSCIGLIAGESHGSLFVEQQGKHRLSLGTGKEQFAGLLIDAEAGVAKRGQAILCYTDDGVPFFALNDRQGKTRIMMSLDGRRKEKPYLALQNEEEKSFFAQAQP